MKYKFTLLISMALIAISSFGQKAVALHSADGVQIFSQATAFADAMEAATDGDTLYLSGGSFPAVNINKGVRIYGAGICPDSTLATLPTEISGYTEIKSGTDSLFVEGLIFNNFRWNADDNDTLRNHHFVRCLFKNGLYVQNSYYAKHFNYSFLQCVFEDEVKLESAVKNSLFANCIFNKPVTESISNVFKNNCFLYSFNGNYSSNEIKNNIFINPNNNLINGSNNQILYNVFANSDPQQGTNSQFLYNKVDIPMDSIFVNAPGETFSFSQNYHLKSAAENNFLGYDSTPIGVYGGFAPLKEGFVPSNPHISSKSIPGATDNAGNLHIEMRINAQQED